MWDRKDVKLKGKTNFKTNYWRSVLSALLISVLAGCSSAASRIGSAGSPGVEDTYDEEYNFDEATDTFSDAYNSIPDDEKGYFWAVMAGLVLIGLAIAVVFFLLKIFVFNPLQVGCYGFFRDNAAGQHPDLGVLKTGFTMYGHTFVTLLLKDIFLLLWTLLLIFPGVIKAYSYRMVPFILRDNPELSATEVITRSRQLMNGHKWNVFVFDLSYIGWFLLGAITLGLVNVFWTEPYRQNANALIYRKLIGEADHAPEEPYVPEAVIPLSTN